MVISQRQRDAIDRSTQIVLSASLGGKRAETETAEHEDREAFASRYTQH